MAQALAKGFIKGGVRKPHQILASAPKNDIQSIEEMKVSKNLTIHTIINRSTTFRQSLGCETTNSNKDVLNNAEVVIMAIKPNVVPKVVHEIRNDISMKNLLVSIALGIPIKAMEDVLPIGSRVVRVMSNTPAIVSEGASVFTLGTFASSNDGDLVKELFSSVGTCDQISENLIDAVTGLSGSGPAYVSLKLICLKVYLSYSSC